MTVTRPHWVHDSQHSPGLLTHQAFAEQRQCQQTGHENGSARMLDTFANSDSGSHSSLADFAQPNNHSHDAPSSSRSAANLKSHGCLVGPTRMTRSPPCQDSQGAHPLTTRYAAYNLV